MPGEYLEWTYRVKSNGKPFPLLFLLLILRFRLYQDKVDTFYFSLNSNRIDLPGLLQSTNKIVFLIYLKMANKILSYSYKS